MIQVERSVYITPLWIQWKSLQIRLRSHLSHFLAILLVILVCIREGHELLPILKERMPTGIEWLIIAVTILTIFAAVWEVRGNKLTTSPQEIRFVVAMRSLLIQLEKFAYGKDREPDVEKRLGLFISDFLDITSTTLCGNKKVNAGFMYPVEGAGLSLLKSSQDAGYPKNLLIPLIKLGGNDKTGPAGIAYRDGKIVHMPVKKWELGWVFEQEGEEESYVLRGSYKGWIKAEKQEEENFRSVLCFPVAVYEVKDHKQAFGVLNYSTRSFDPFVTRDYIMGECFSSILAQAFAIAQIERDAKANAQAEEVQK